MKTSRFITVACIVCIGLTSGVKERNNTHHYPEFDHFCNDFTINSEDWVLVENKDEIFYEYILTNNSSDFTPYRGFVKVIVKEKDMAIPLPFTRYKGGVDSPNNYYIEYNYEAKGFRTLIIKARVSNKEKKPEKLYINVEILTAV